MVLLVFFASCEESLPPREDPPQVLTASLSVEPGPAILEDSISVGRGGTINMDVTNLYDEVLQDTAQIRGTVDVWMRTDTTRRATIRFDERALLSGGALQHHVLTIRVNQKIYFAHQWSHRTDDSVYFWRFANLTLYYDGQGRPYYASDTLLMAARGSLQVFKKVQPIQLPEVHYSIWYFVR